LKSIRVKIQTLCLLLTPLLAGGCDSWVAYDFVKAPNLDWPTRGKDAPPDVLAQHYVTKQLRIKVGPPAATLSVWIIDAIQGHGTIIITRGRYPDGIAVRLNVSDPIHGGPPPPRGTLFLLPGRGDSKEDPAYELYSLVLATEGYRVILVDQRGHGRSTGDLISYGAHESHDMVQVLDALEKQGLVCGEVGVMGISYGASVGICWAAIDPRIHGVVAIEPFSSIRDASADAGPQFLGVGQWFYTSKDYADITMRIGQLAGFDPDRDSPLYAIAHTSTPVLIFHGLSDKFLRPAHSIRLHAADPDHSRLILIAGANHFDLWLVAIRTIMQQSDEWFARYLTTSVSISDPTTRPDKIN
jgi:pimeloyl-ACP methyl ester carboxylesterase